MKNVLFFHSLVVATACSLITGCTGKGNRDNYNDSLSDSLALAAQVDVEPARLPSDIQESAKKAVSYNVVLEDSAISGQLSSLRDLYEDIPGAFTFRKGSKRQANFGGKLEKTPKSFKIEWTFKTAENYRQTSVGSWGGGTGWTGEPVYVEWPDSCLNKMKSNNAVYPDFSGKEIIFGSLCGNVYFVDFSTGKPSRDPIVGLNPIKGSVSLDPTLNGNLYVGQGVPVERPFGAFMVDLYTNKKDFYRPEDPKAQRRWGAFDSSSVRVGQFLFIPGENGSIYKYLISPGNLKLHSILRYKVNGAAPGIEASMAVYSNYGFVADNHGNILAIDLESMNPVWHYALGDDTDSTPIIVEEDGIPYLYVGCEIDRQGTSGTANFAKLKATDGTEIWRKELPGKRYDINSKHFDGGFYSTSLLGSGNCKELIFAQCVRNTNHQNGEFIAFNRKTGEIKYQIPLNRYAWCSPVGFLDPADRLYIVTGDCAGNLYLIDGEKGEIIHEEKVGNNFESSPVVTGNSFVVGSRGNSIYKITLE